MDNFHTMEHYYISRTNNHINRVHNWLKKYSNAFKINVEYNHDNSKFSKQEYVPYIYMTWYYKCKKENKEFKYPEGMESKTELAWDHHKSNNSHHPEYHKNIVDMGINDLLEFCADLSAMSDEFSGHPLEYFKNNIRGKFKFTKNQLNIINSALFLY